MPIHAPCHPVRMGAFECAWARSGCAWVGKPPRGRMPTTALLRTMDSAQSEFSGALISMMARSTRFNQKAGYIDARPPPPLAELSCDAPPDHTLDQIRTKQLDGARSGLPPEADLTPPRTHRPEGANKRRSDVLSMPACLSAAGPVGIQLRKCVSTLKDQCRASLSACGERPDLRQPFAELISYLIANPG